MKILKRLQLWWLVHVQVSQVAKLEDALQACKDTLAVLESDVLKRGPDDVRREWAAVYRVNEAYALGLRKVCIARQNEIDRVMVALGLLNPVDFLKRSMQLNDTAPTRH